ncbi:MAG: BamA/TamA family outer membrane protein [Bacteroidota bacterium]
MGSLYKITTSSKILLSACLLLVGTPGFSQSPVKNDSVKLAIEPLFDHVNKTHRFIFGESYRKLWAAPVKMRVFHLSREKGGLKILQRGGGMQTKSLRLQDAGGQEWVLRTIQKYPERVLPPTLRKSVAASIIADQISTEHPFAALVVPPLAKALGVPHANPEIVFVPDDPAFGEYQKDFANQVFLFEEREPLDASKTDNTDKAQDKLQDDNDNSVDQKLFLKARLLDMLLGDWDRHEDQWRWERTKGKDGIVYEPVPRDRDQVFSSTSGAFPWLASRHLLMAKFQSYEDHIRSVNRWNLNGRNIDRYFLNGLSQQDWETAITEVQGKLTDQIITRSIKLMPDTIYKLCGAELIQKLIARRNILKRQALKYYRFLSQTVEIPGTDKREHIDITNEASGQVSVRINKLKKDGNQDRIIYQRTFDPKVTNEIRLYGMGGEDVFAVHGEASSPIIIRMVGGSDEDTFAIDSNIHSKGNLYIYDRSDEKNKLPGYGQVHLRTSTDTSVNSFVKRNFKYDFLQPLILGSYNKDYGVQFIGNFIYQKQGFRKDPYAFRQSLMVNYGFGTSSLLLNYTGEFKQAIGKSDLLVNVLSKGPNYTSYFFGTGNNSVFVNSGSQRIRYYRNIYNYLDGDVRIRHNYGNWTINGGIAGQYYHGDDDDNLNKYLKLYDTQHPNEKVFSEQGFAGLIGGFSLDTRNKSIVPHTGVYWETNLRGMKGMGDNAHSYGQIESEFGFYLNAANDSTFIVADRIGVGTTLGNAGYYQQLKLGGNQNLRGFYSWRFTGKSMAFNNFEVRVKLADVTSYLLPGTLGMLAFNDVGRVWSPGETSSQLHVGYGGGLFFLPGDLFLIQGVVGFSKEGAYPYISAGFRF